VQQEDATAVSGASMVVAGSREEVNSIVGKFCSTREPDVSRS
jgi:hypothetical protein